MRREITGPVIPGPGEVFALDSRHIIEIVDKNLAARMDLSRNYSDKELKELIDDCLDNLEKRVPMIGIDRVNIRNTVYNSRRRFGLIQRRDLHRAERRTEKGQRAFR